MFRTQFWRQLHGINIMAKNIDNIINSLPEKRQRRIDAQYQKLKREVENLKELRDLAGCSQIAMAAELKIAQPSVSKMERQGDMYVSTLRNYVEALGGRLELLVHLPAGDTVVLQPQFESSNSSTTHHESGRESDR